jgi:hypothetical protein
MRGFWAVVVVAFVLVLGAGALGADTASAKETLQLKSPDEGGRLLEPGNYVEGESAGGTTVESTEGTLACRGGSWAGLYGKVQTNSEKTDRLSITGSKRNFDGGSCTGSFAVGDEPRNFWTGGSELGSMTVATNGHAQFKSSTSTEAKLELESAETGHFCSYGLKELKGIASYGEGDIVTIEFHQQTVKLVAHNIESCPKKVSISVGFGLKTAPPGSQEEKSLSAFNFVEGIISAA